MTSRTAPIQFDPTEHYILSEAFFRVGLALFPYDWRGTEQFALTVENFAALKREKVRLEKLRTRYRERAKAFLEVDVTDLSDTEYQDHRDNQNKVKQHELEARDQIERIRDTFGSKFENDETWTRRLTVEKRLCDAFLDQDLTLRCVGGFDLDWGQTYQQNDFSISFAYSLVYVSRRISSRRKNVACIERKEFDRWYAVQADFSENGVQKSQTELVRDFFFTVTESETKPMQKRKVLDLLKRRFPQMSDRQAQRHWDSFAPEEWKRPGPKS